MSSNKCVHSGCDRTDTEFHDFTIGPLCDYRDLCPPHMEIALRLEAEYRHYSNVRYLENCVINAEVTLQKAKDRLQKYNDTGVMYG